MTVAVVALAIALAGALSLVGWLAYVALSARSATADEREDHTATRGELERVRFEQEVTKSRLADAERMNAALQEVLADVQAVDHGLSPADVRSRVLRAAQQAKAAAAGSPVSAGAGEAVPASTATGGPDAAGVSSVVGIDDKLLAPSD